MVALIKALLSGILRRGLPIFAGLGVGDILHMIFRGKKLPSPLPTPEPVYKDQPGRWQKMIVLAIISSIVLTLIVYLLKRMRIKIPFLT
jgi:hypothetical protein